MKILHLFALAVLPGFLGNSVHAQLLQLTGHVTSTSGIYAGAFTTNALVSLSFDCTTPPEDVFHGQQSVSTYLTPFAFTVAGETVVLGLSPLTAGVSLANGPLRDGLIASIGWNGAHPGEFLQYLDSADDLLYSRTYFPDALPMEAFARTSGYYQNSSSELWGGSGRIEWEITAYSGTFEGVVTTPPPTITPVPEPATYGLLGTVGLLAAAIYRGTKRSHPALAA